MALSRWAAIVVGATLIVHVVGAAQPMDSSAPPVGRPLQEVLVTAQKLPREKLKQLAIQFVQSHGVDSPVIHQIGRWQAAACPRVTGLQPAANGFVSDRVMDIARRVGAPVPAREKGKGCAVNIEIVFTPQPQQLLNRIAKAYPALLGSSRSAGDATSNRAIQSWYTSGSKVMSGWTPPAPPISGPGGSIVIGAQAVGPALMMALQQDVDASTPPGVIARDGARVDPAYGEGFAGFGKTGSYFGKGFVSELLQAFIVVDTGKVAGNSLSSISNYVGMLALTRMSALDGCNELPSIIDLLSSGCGAREKPLTLTETDTAYLKALYSSNLEKNLNLEQGEIRDRMVKTITGR